MAITFLYVIFILVKSLDVQVFGNILLFKFLLFALFKPPNST